MNKNDWNRIIFWFTLGLGIGCISVAYPEPADQRVSVGVFWHLEEDGMDGITAIKYLHKVLEGDEVTDYPHDAGGLTGSGGVTQRRYDEYRAKHGLPQQSVRRMTDQEKVDIGWEYWNNTGVHLPPSVDFMVFQFAYVAGEVTAVRMLQKIIGCKPDGHIGPKTQAAVAAQQPGLLLVDLADKQMEHFLRVDVGEKRRDLKGHLKRITRSLRFALKVQYGS